VKRARNSLLMVLLLAFAIRAMWWAIAPMVPIALGFLVLVLIVGTLYHRKSRW